MMVLLFLTTTGVFAQSKKIYENFPEKFDTEETKDKYATALVELKSGTWKLNGVTLVSKTGARAITEDGTKGAQFNKENAKPLYLQMMFDVPDGVSKVTVKHASYGNDPACKWTLEYSIDSGKTWQEAGKEITSFSKSQRTATFDKLNIQGPVRFRVIKFGLGGKDDPSIANGRLLIDDFTIYR